MSRIRVAVLRGGFGDEYKASLWTGASVLEHIDRSQFDPIDIVISKSGEWIVDGVVRLPEQILHSVDVVFNALHGTFGEDGTVQRLLERYAVPYTGSKAMASGIAMNKVTTKECLKESGIKMPQHVRVSRDSVEDVGRVAEKIVDTFGPQYIIKPVNAGSSVGTMSVKNPLLLQQALTDALGSYDEVLVEAKIPGREATCGVIDRYRDKNVYTLPPIEIVLPKDADFFSTELKRSNNIDYHCPSRFSRSEKNELEFIAQMVHEALNLSQYSRSDFIVADDGIYFLEVNTLPGLTKESLFSNAITAVGGSYRDFITHLITDTIAMQRRYK
jgi:D-alanine-D-alanine ligase